MSAFDAYSILTTKFGQLAPLLVGEASLFQPRFWDRSNIFVMAEDQTYTPATSATPSFGSEVRWILPKRATLLGCPMIEWTLAAAGAAGANTAAYVNNVGDQILDTVTMRYGSHILQTYPGEVQQIYRRVSKHEVFEENRDELTLGNRRYAIRAQEDEREAFYRTGGVLYSPLDELWFTHHFDEHWMPEAFATEAELIVTVKPLARIVYTSDGAVPSHPALPTITAAVLRVREITLTAPEKAQRLKYYNSAKGMLTHFLDTEVQARAARTITLAGAANQTFRVKLDNIRLDVAWLAFLVRKAGTGVGVPSVNQDWSGDPLDSAAGVVAHGGVSNAVETGTILPITTFRFEANGSRLTNDIPEKVNRCFQRMLYFKDSQSRDFIYFYSPAAIPDNRKHVTGFLNAANLGNLELVVTVPQPAGLGADLDVEIDVFSLSHNIMQMRRGDAVKSLK